jgi:mono/diheme cytochrome c family protein
MRKLIILVASAGLSTAASDSQAGKAIFEKSCRTCHGANGQGNPSIAKMLNVSMRPLDSAEVQARSDAEIKKFVLEGNGKMKPVKLTDSQVADIIAYLRGLPKNK